MVMAINGISSYTSSASSRVSGLASNMDTDSMVKKAMEAETAKYTRILQKRQLDEWRIDSYREVTSTLQGFYKEYFDTISTKNLKSENSFASFAATYAATNSTDYVSVTPGASAKAGTYSLTDLKAATAASIQGGNTTKQPVDGLEILDASVANLKSVNDNNTFEFTLNNITKQFTLNDTGTLTTVQGLQTELQNKIDGAFGAGKITVGFTANGTADGGKLSFSSVRSTDTFSIGTAYNDGSSKLFSAAPTATSTFTIHAQNNKFELTVGGVTKTVTVPLGAGGTPKAYTDPAALAADIQAAAEAAFPALPAGTFTVKDGKVIFASVSIGSTKNGANTAIGIDPSNMSNKLNLTAKINDIKGGFSTALNVTGIGNDIEFTINGKYFRFNSKDSSINDIIKKVNADITINATMKYDITTNSFKVESRGSGATDKVVVEDKTGNLMQTLKIADTDFGSDASFKIDGVEIVRPTNVFTYDGLTFDIKKDSLVGADPIKVTVTSDTTKTFDYIKTFVDKYNEVIDKLNTKISEKKNKDFAPLTDEQRTAMSEDQIKTWETKAKSGLLKNDSIVTETLSKLRSSLYASVEGTGITLASIGITTSANYEDKGKLVIDEAKLKNALSSKPEEVMTLFTSSSDITYYESINSSSTSSLRSQRYKESGIAQRFSDIIQDSIRTNTDSSGNKGLLLEKAGILGDRSEYSSFLSKEILQYDDDAYEMNKKLSAKENALYKKYAAMESALNKLNSQQSSLAQMLGQ
jgi:flagellar hook-associated protein 2